MDTTTTVVVLQNFVTSCYTTIFDIQVSISGVLYGGK